MIDVSARRTADEIVRRPRDAPNCCEAGCGPKPAIWPRRSISRSGNSLFGKWTAGGTGHVQLASALRPRAAAESLQAERDRWLIRWEQTAVRLGVVIAEKLIQRQLVARPEIATDMISDALRLAVGQPQLTVYLHPQDLAAWGDRASQIVQSLAACADTTLVPDSETQRGGCRIETRHGEIDARVETMLQRIGEDLVEV